jgi:AcrR family transcriptional regulator
MSDSVMARAESLFFRSVPDGRDHAAVTADQRARLLDAMTRVVVRKGYARTTVADVVEVASVSRRTFYEQFVDKEACFLAAYETAGDIVLGDIAGAVRGTDGGWRERLKRALETYTNALAAEPEVAQLYLLDVLGAGPKAIDLRRRVLGRFVEQLRAVREHVAAEEPGAGEASDALLRALVGGMNELVQEHILQHGASTLAELTPTLEDLAHAILTRSRQTARA